MHPNKTAIDYIWGKFKDSWISEEAENLFKNIEYIQKGISHRPFNENSDKYTIFLQKIDDRIRFLNVKIPHLQKDDFFKK